MTLSLQERARKCSQQFHTLRNLLRTCQELGISGELIEAILDLFKKRTAQVYGVED